MKNKVIAMIIPLAFSIALGGNIQANPEGVHKIRTKMTGLLQTGTDPNTFVLSNISKGYTIKNQTGQDPFLLARAGNIVLVPQGEEEDLRSNVGQQVRVSGYFTEQECVGLTSQFIVTDVDPISKGCETPCAEKTQTRCGS